jgi:hypothetical protein
MLAQDIIIATFIEYQFTDQASNPLIYYVHQFVYISNSERRVNRIMFESNTN